VRGAQVERSTDGDHDRCRSESASGRRCVLPQCPPQHRPGGHRSRTRRAAGRGSGPDLSVLQSDPRQHRSRDEPGLNLTLAPHGRAHRLARTGGEDIMAFTIKVNEGTHSVDVDADTPLLWVLRDVLGMTGTKFGCGQALCGACTVHVDGQAVRSCQTTVDSVGDSAITTIEAIGQAPQGAALQKAWLELEVVQCGYCQSGQIMSAAA